jgi:hypothetical protein
MRDSDKEIIFGNKQGEFSKTVNNDKGRKFE